MVDQADCELEIFLPQPPELGLLLSTTMTGFKNYFEKNK
jgi:hypothetical protein